MKVHELCTRELVSIAPTASARDAAALMATQQVGTLVVVDAERRPVGVLTNRDLVWRALATARVPGTLTVESVMSTRPVLIGADETVHEAIRRMREHCVRRLPVVDADGRAIGLINLRAVLGCITSDVREVGSLMAREQGYWGA